ncbi:hypothetical protein [Oceanobacillus oncorhynchi]|uniref:hypothetical protein n=1 Tax=Oceanobacillus oncorhynchi TaxID=545501 RepID=UPI0034D798DE
MAKLTHRKNIGRKKDLTCIVGIAESGRVFMGGDSAGVDGSDNMTIRKDSKVFILDDRFIIGFTSSFRMGQVLQYKLKVPIQKENQCDFEFMVTDFIDSVKESFKENGCEEGVFLVGYKGTLYTIYGDFQVEMTTDQVHAVGCGATYALGSLYASGGGNPNLRILTALRAAEHYSSGVSSPFTFKHLGSGDDFDKSEEDAFASTNAEDDDW